MSVLVIYRKVLLRLLNQGYDPYSDMIELYKNINDKNNVVVSTDLPNENLDKPDTIQDKISMTIQEAFDFGMKLKEKLISPTQFITMWWQCLFIYAT
ncbi:hypothetical protein [Maribacter sp. 1_MG-2023]|uniref:hypothetical protein n=1 Tax=Maribacter sp. 1_MG-2023 TaxID=3062677 RepID=UPI0026E3A1CD|nr:hypothetical protein [Maribacter sp. 1_MG-2023]MDO6473344.1 hypothetical protein [Maribacter sp. 1_MG-2023]